MIPTLTPFNKAYDSLGHAKPCRNRSLKFADGECGFYVSYVLVCKFGVSVFRSALSKLWIFPHVMLLSFGAIRSAFFYFIRRIFSGGSEPKVQRVYAGGVVTCVANIYSGRYIPVQKRERKPVCHYQSSIDGKSSIAEQGFMGCPVPATFNFRPVNFIPESLDVQSGDGIYFGSVINRIHIMILALGSKLFTDTFGPFLLLLKTNNSQAL